MLILKFIAQIKFGREKKDIYTPLGVKCFLQIYHHIKIGFKNSILIT